MNTTTPQYTPETGEGYPSLANFTIQKLERERDEAREHLALYREQCAAANKGAEINAHINHSLAAKLAEAKRELNEAREQLKAMREVIDEVNKILLSIQRNDIFEETMRKHATCALTKLQPFIKP